MLLLVSLTLLKVTSLFIQWAPLAGLSGCTYSLIIEGNNRVKQGDVTLHPVCPASHAVGVHIQPVKQGGGDIRVKQGEVNLHPVGPASQAVGVHIQPEKQGGGTI